MRLRIAAVLAAAAWCAEAAAPVVQTSSGNFQGHAAPNAANVWEFLGIRYAQPPLGELRFAAPETLQNVSQTTVDASTWVSAPNFLFRSRALRRAAARFETRFLLTRTRC